MFDKTRNMWCFVDFRFFTSDVKVIEFYSSLRLNFFFTDDVIFVKLYLINVGCKKCYIQLK